MDRSLAENEGTMQRTVMTEEHELFRSSVRTFIGREIVPRHPTWEKEGIVTRDVWESAGRNGFLGLGVPEEDGGSGVDDFRYNAVLAEELARANASGPGFSLQTDIVAPYLLRLATPEQRRRWLPGFSAGTIISAIAMTEPAAGSDLQGMRTRATPDGDGWVLNGQKTFITNGINADLVIVAARTDPDAGARGISLLCVERGMDGFDRGRNLDKIGMHAQDTAELFFRDVHVPRENLLGTLGGGFIHLMENLPQERLSIAVTAIAGAESALAETLKYTQERTAFGRPVSTFQNTRFLLAELATETQVGRVFVDRCIEEHAAGRLTSEDAAMAKWWSTELQQRVVDRCVQLHGGYGYMLEYPIAKRYLDVRIASIYGGTTEIMKEIIGRRLMS